MHPHLRRYFSVLVLFLLAPAIGSAQTPATPAQIARIDQVARYYVEKGDFRGSVLVAQGDRVVFDKAYGFANEEWQVANTPDTKFRLGSITKQFTAACVLLLEERGKLKTSDLLKQYMTDAPPAWDKITIFHLLTHTSGIPNFTSFPDYEKLQSQPTTPEDLVARFRSKPLDFEPGTKYSYSNSGYEVLGWLIEKVSGQKYADFLEQNIFVPLGMRDSGYDDATPIIAHRASGYQRDGSKLANAAFVDMTIPYSAGSLYSTTHDLLIWEQGLFGGKVLKPESLKKMTTPFLNNYAFGLGVRTANGRTEISHSGGINGFNTSMRYWPEEKLAVIALANQNGLSPDLISSAAAKVIHGDKVILPSERKQVSVAPDVLKAYVGTYEVTPTLSLNITLEGTQLMAQAGNQPKNAIFPESATSFFAKDNDAQIEFVKNEKGEVTGLVLSQNGREMKATKK